MKCYACFNEIVKGESICSNCGTNQEDLHDFLTLSILYQQKKEINIPEDTNIYNYLVSIDPSLKEKLMTISTEGSSYPSPQPTLQGQSQTQYSSSSLSKQDEKPYIPIKGDEKPITTSSESMINCPNCGLEIRKQAKFCKFCGEKMVKECNNCGHQNRSQAKFCTKCGNNLN